MAEPRGAHLSIGEVLGLLLEEFPDVTISKIRFLESQGLIEPERTPSGYRKFFDEDVELLRVILREQRERFLPLRVIKDRIDSGEIDRRDPTPPRGHDQPTSAQVAKHPAAGATPTSAPSSVATADDPPPTAPASPTTTTSTATTTAPPAAPPRAVPERAAPAESQPAARLLPGVLVNRDELCAMASITREQLAQLEEYGVVPKRGGAGELYGDEAVEIAAAAGGFLRAGVDARHLRAWRTSAEREAGLYEQLILPTLRQRNPQARSQAAKHLSELDALGGQLRAAMMRAALRQYLE
jgi:DNA-binding transcriptional MerR regulator